MVAELGHVQAPTLSPKLHREISCHEQSGSAVPVTKALSHADELFVDGRLPRVVPRIEKDLKGDCLADGCWPASMPSQEPSHRGQPPGRRRASHPGDEAVPGRSGRCG